MKSYIVPLLYTLFFMLVPVVTMHAQYNNADFDSIRSTYKRMTDYDIELEYRFYKDHDFPVATENAKAEMKKSGEQYCYKILGTETIINKDYILVLSHKRKTLVIEKYKKPNAKKIQALKKPVIDSVLAKVLKNAIQNENNNTTIKENKISDTQKQYAFYYTSGVFSSLSFTYNVNTYIIEKIVMCYRKKIQTDKSGELSSPRVEMVYTSIQQHPKFDKDVFSEKKYITILKDGKVQLSPEIASYAVVNHLGKK